MTETDVEPEFVYFKYAGQVQNYNAERAAEGARIERIEKWIEKAAEKVNVPLEY